jgi:hypothetical protein
MKTNTVTMANAVEFKQTHLAETTEFNGLSKLTDLMLVGSKAYTREEWVSHLSPSWAKDKYGRWQFNGQRNFQRVVIKEMGLR